MIAAVPVFGPPQDQYQRILDAVGEGVHVIGRDGAIQFENPAATKMLGWELWEMMGKSAHSLIHHTRADGSPYPVDDCPIYATLRDGIFRRVEDEVFWRKHGTSVPVAYTCTPLLGENGDIVGAVVAFRDITEGRRAETALREAHDRLEGRVRERTSDLAAINESLREEIRQRGRAEALMKGNKEVLGLIATGRPLPNILETLSRHMEAHTGALCSILLMDEDGIRLRHGAAPSLPEAYNQAIDGTVIGPTVGSCGAAAFLRRQVIVADIATDPLWANFKDLALRHELRACWSTPIQAADGRVLGTFALYWRQPRTPAQQDFSSIDRAAYLASIAIERQQAEAAIHAAQHDLESRIIARTAQLKAKNDELKTFAYTVSHDLKAPLRGITGYAQELERRHKEGLGERAQFCIIQILTAARNLDALIEDLLKYSRVDADMPTFTRVKLPDLMQSILADRTHTLTEQGVEVTVNIPSLTLPTWERGLHQVLTNLVDNAIKYSRNSRPPRLTITAEAVKGGCRVTVADNGIGFDMKYYDRIFGLFNRLVRANEFEGTGAGLAIVRKLLDKLGATVRAESAPGQGATFFLELPGPPTGRDTP